jgi:hypothetical protein
MYRRKGVKMKEKAQCRDRNTKENYLNMHTTTFKCTNVQKHVDDDRMKA